jgi:hypothetical protein
MPRPLGDDMTYVRGLLRDTQASDRFAELFGEMATVAVIAREAYGDPALGRDEILSYEAHSSAFFNSFRHA